VSITYRNAGCPANPFNETLYSAGDSMEQNVTDNYPETVGGTTDCLGRDARIGDQAPDANPAGLRENQSDLIFD
jgi:hypothetical protein